MRKIFIRYLLVLIIPSFLFACKGSETNFSSGKKNEDAATADDLNPELTPPSSNEFIFTNEDPNGDGFDGNEIDDGLTPGTGDGSTDDDGDGLGINVGDGGDTAEVRYSNLEIQVSSRVDQGTIVNIIGADGKTHNVDIYSANISMTLENACFQDKNTELAMTFNGKSISEGSKVTALGIANSSNDEVQIAHESKPGQGYDNSYDTANLKYIDDVVFTISCNTNDLTIKNLAIKSECSYSTVVSDDC